ncbi:hypothetical protein GF327_02175 [Candidatus Woesearchaeota archaeon]|nr:hypothetical protein [Candidatus Woesearchaeota archaeon]
MNKKAIESVEVWMWLIAGLIIGSLIFVSGYTLLSNWVHNNEVNQAMNSYSLLKASISNVCAIGRERQEIESFVFPRIVQNISVKNETSGEYGKGHSLCMYLEERICEELDKEPFNCKPAISMNTIYFNEDESLFTVVRKATGEKMAAKVKFSINKAYDSIEKEDKITITWKEEFLE